MPLQYAVYVACSLFWYELEIVAKSISLSKSLVTFTTFLPVHTTGRKKLEICLEQQNSFNSQRNFKQKLGIILPNNAQN